jgi:hypothetical protein
MAVQTTINPQGPGTSHAGPVIAGPRSSGSTAFPIGGNQGILPAVQVVVLNQNGANAVSATINVPKHSQLLNFVVDTTTAWNGSTSPLTIGVSAGDSTYSSGLTGATAGRASPTFTGAQLLAMSDTGTTEAVVMTVTPTGTTTAGQLIITIYYRQTQNYQNN